MRITITNEQTFLPVEEKKIYDAIRLLPGADKKYRLSVVYVDDKEITKMNERYLQHEGPTDVLAFPISSKEGEIVVSAETALREAKERDVESEGELLLYTLHGTLHLLGFDDKEKEESMKMHAVEKQILTQLGYKWSWDEDVED
ncbi:MAG: rRNA maturation RNase YbeY [Candidatus Brocadiae bacterium]|nr:rRNA maturation RNase YbeY [Candidatus Brocadiia bacterium]